MSGFTFSASGGGVACGHLLAARAGIDVLNEGGSAVDAVLAIAFCQWVVNGPLCGPGGDLFVLHAARGEATVYGGWSRTPERFPVRGPIVASGPAGAVVPGALAGAEAAWERAGRLSWSRLFAEAIRLANGHHVTPWMARSYRGVIERGNREALERSLNVSEAPCADDVVSYVQLGRTLQRLAVGGAHEFYHGSLARDLLRAAASDGAYLTSVDLDGMEASIGPAVTYRIGELEVTVPPPPSQAAIVPRLLQAADRDDSADGREFTLAVAPLVQDELTSRCIVGVPGTAAAVASDGEGMAAVVHSLAGVQFGSGWIAGNTGVAFGNRVGTSLSMRSDLPGARPVPGAVLAHTLSAALFHSNDRAVLAATPGGDRQVQWLAQAGQRFRQGESIHQIVDAPRWFVCPEGDRFGVPEGIGKEWFLFAEPSVPWAAHHRVGKYTVRQMQSVGGGLQAIEHRGGDWSVASDRRACGAALVRGGSNV